MDSVPICLALREPQVSSPETRTAHDANAEDDAEITAAGGDISTAVALAQAKPTR